MDNLFNALDNSNPGMRWGMLIVVLIGIIVLGKAASVFLKYLSKRKFSREHRIASSVIRTFSKSITLILFTTGYVVGLKLLVIPDAYLLTLTTVSKVLITISVGFFTYYLVEVPSVGFEELLKKKDSRLSHMFLPVMRKTLRGVIILLVLFQIIQIFSDKPLTSIIAGLGIGGLAVALAAQDTLKHFIGSFVIAGDKPFEIGDRVVIDGHDGPVESIGLRSTRIRTLEGHLVTIPNGELANRTIQNVGKRPHIRRIGNVGVTYDTKPDKVEEAVEIIKDILANHEGMHEDFPPQVYFNEFNADNLNIFFIYWYHPALYWDYMAFSEKVNFEILKRFNAAGIEFAFPTQTVHVKS